MILCCGESLIDMLPRQATTGESSFAPHAGGAVFNTAIALGRLGAETAMFSGISTDMFGDILAETLQASKVSTAYVHRADQPCTLAFVKLVEGQATYAFYDENTAGRMIAPSAIPDLGDDVGALFFGGISLVVEPCGATYEAMMQREHGARVTMIDPNIRPGFIKDEAAYRARIDRMLAMADIVKLSDEDLLWLMGGDDLDAQANKVLSMGPKLVCITRGKEGASGYTARGRVDVGANAVTVVDTVGAGDTFNAGVLASLDAAGVLTKEGVANLSDAVIADALSLGARSAAITVSRAGANPPWTHEL